MTISANSAGSPSTTDYATGFTIAPGTQDGQYTITYNASADYSQTGPDQTDILYVYPDAAFSVSDTTLLINSPAGSGLTDDSLTITSTSVGANISAYLYTVTKDEDGGFSETYTTGIVSVSSGTLEGGSWGAGNYNVSLRVTGGGGLENTETDTSAFSITNHPPQALTITNPVSVHIARRGTATSITWSKTSATAVTIKSYKGGVLVASISNSNTGTSTSWTPDGGDSLGTDWTIYGSVDSGTVSDHSDQFTLKDGIATAPTIGSPANGNGSITANWSDGSYNSTNTVYIYNSAQSLVTTAGSSGTSYTYTADAGVNIAAYYFKVTGTNAGSEEGALSSFSSVAYIYPTLNVSRNVIAPNISTIYSTTNNNNTGTYPTSVTYNTPTTPTNNVNTRTYSTSALTGHVFGNSSATSHAATTTTYGGGTAIGSRTITLAIAGDLSQNSSTSHGVTINYMPRIYSISYTGGEIVENSTTFSISGISWQGHDVTSLAGFQVAVYTSSGGSTEVSTLGALNISGATLTDGTPEGATGTTQTQLTWAALGGVSLGNITTNGTMWIRVSDNTGTMTAFEESFTVVGWGNVSVYGWEQLVGQYRAWDTQEEAVGASIPGSAVGPFSDTLYYLGTLGSTDPIEFKTSSGGSAFNGGNYWWDLAGGYIGRINSSGQMTAANYIADAQAQPIAPTLNAFSGITTSQIVINWNDNSGIEDNYYLYQDDSSAASISNYDNVYTIAQNVETYSNTSLTTNTPSTSLTATAHPTINGRIDLSWSVSGHTSFVVYEGTSWPPSTSIATSGTSATRTGLADSQIYYYSIIAQGSGKTYYYGLYAKNGNTLSSIAQGSSATTAGVHTTYDDATTIAAAADPTVSITCTASSYWNAGTGVWAKSTFLDGFTIQTDTFTVTSADRDGNIVRLQVWQTNGGFFEWKDQTSDSSWHSGAPSNGWAYVGSSTSAEVNMEDNNTNYFRLQREMNSSGANSPDLKVRCRVIKGGTSYYSNAIIFRPDGIFS
jgi:hypothetical protein